MTETLAKDQTKSKPVFMIEVEEVLRGAAPETLAVESLRSGLPPRGERSCRQASTLRAAPGDLIVFAIEGKIPGRKGRYTTAAWLEGLPSNDIANPGLQRIDINDVRRLMVDLGPVPSFRAILSGRALSINGNSLVLEDVQAVPWLNDWPSPTTGQWDLESFADGWDNRPESLDPPTAVVRFAKVAGPQDIELEVTNIEADGEMLRLGFAAIESTLPEGSVGPASLFVDIEADPRTW